MFSSRIAVTLGVIFFLVGGGLLFITVKENKIELSCGDLVVVKFQRDEIRNQREFDLLVKKFKTNQIFKTARINDKGCIDISKHPECSPWLNLDVPHGSEESLVEQIATFSKVSEVYYVPVSPCSTVE